MLLRVLGLVTSLLIVGAPAAEAQQINFASANYWLPLCRSPTGSFEHQRCVDYFYGFDAAMSLMGGTGGVARTGNVVPYCLPQGVSFDQAIRVVVAFADRNPQYTHYHFGVMAAAGLAQAFPCR